MALTPTVAAYSRPPIPARGAIRASRRSKGRGTSSSAKRLDERSGVLQLPTAVRAHEPPKGQLDRARRDARLVLQRAQHAELPLPRR